MIEVQLSSSKRGQKFEENTEKLNNAVLFPGCSRVVPVLFLGSLGTVGGNGRSGRGRTFRYRRKLDKKNWAMLVPGNIQHARKSGYVSSFDVQSIAYQTSKILDQEKEVRVCL
jgi:hypothetical protein